MANTQINSDGQVASEIPLYLKGNHWLPFLLVHVTQPVADPGQNIWGLQHKDYKLPFLPTSIHCKTSFCWDLTPAPYNRHVTRVYII